MTSISKRRFLLRVSELTGLTLDSLSGPQLESIHILGKGRRERELPLWRETKTVLNEWLDVRPPVNNRYLFLNARGRAMSTDGFAYILDKHVATAVRTVPSIERKRVTPHVLRHYIDCLTMSGTTGSRAIFVCNCRFGEGRLPGFPDIVLVDLQAAEKAEQPVTGLVAAGVAGWRRCFGQCLLFHCQRRLQIDLGGLNRFVSEPQRNHRAIDACLKKVHCRRMAQAVDSDPLLFQRGACP